MLLYNSSKWQKLKYNKFSHSDEKIKDLIKEESDKYPNIQKFFGDIYSRLYSGDKVKPKEVYGLDHFKKADKMLSETKEFKMMVEKCKNNSLFSEIATSAFSKGIMERIPEIEKPIKDVNELYEKKKNLEEIIQEVKQQKGDTTFFDMQLSDVEEEIIEEEEKEKSLIEEMDESNIRSGIKLALSKSDEAIDKVVKIRNSIGIGSSDFNSLHNEDEALIKKLIEMTDKSKDLEKIFDLAGRFDSLFETVKKKKTDIKSNEIIGVEKGKDLTHLLDSELVNLASNEDLFYSRYHKNELDQYELDSKEQQKGPIIFLLDCSGSMTNYSNHIKGKALLLTMMKEANRQKRDFIAHNFTNVIKESYHSKNDTKLNLLPILLRKAYGGTNINWALDRAISNVSDSLPDADIILITDGADSLSSETRKAFLKRKSEVDCKLITIFLELGGVYKPDIEPISDVFIRGQDVDKVLEDLFKNF